MPGDTRVHLIGGPLDGWPIVIRGRLPDTLRLPFSHEMLELASRPVTPDLGEAWRAASFPAEDEADGIAVYRLVSGDEPSREPAAPRYAFAESGASGVTN